jgi:carbamoyl-phosphate synthase large subunit
MPKLEGIKKVVMIGSGGIRIGQAAEFDYSGSQALKALREEGIETVLINPNVATIQTSQELADKVYLEPITFEFVEKIIKKEKPDGILLSFGGQTALNVGVKLFEKGILKKYGVKVLGTPIKSVMETEDREKFRKVIKSIGVSVPPSQSASSVNEALRIAKKIGYPVIGRVAYTLGGQGSDVAWNEEELRKVCKVGLKQSMINQILIEKYLHHWKEIEYEVVRDKKDNCITVCNMENFDPMGIHTGDSIVVAPSQTLTNKEYHMLRSIAIKVIRSLKIIGECNIQFALNPKGDEYYVIEVNARLSRSSALASKATGYPLAYVAAKLAIGYTLPELLNKVTLVTTADFEPSLDYVVVKIPRWEFQKFRGAFRKIGSQMRSIGEVMGVGRTFEEALQKAVRELEIGKELIGNPERKREVNRIKHDLKFPTDERLFRMVEAIKSGISIETIHRLSGVDLWFIHKIKNILDLEKILKNIKITSPEFPKVLKKAKKLGFSDEGISKLLHISQGRLREIRKYFGIIPVVKQIDTLAAEFPAKTNYLYFTYNASKDDIKFSRGEKILVLGAGPIRIGSSVEFDWCTMNCVWTLRNKGIKTIVLNCNPETVSTDYDESDELYFEEISLERVLDIIEKENPLGVIVSVGGQTSNNLAYSLSKRGVNLFGTSGKDIDSAENRKKFSSLLDSLGIVQPVWKSLTTLNEIKRFSEKIGYPVILRPSYVLSGSAMKVAWDGKELENYVKRVVKVSRDYPVVISKFVEGAKEVEVDGVGDGEDVLIGAIIEHIENAGVHSGDATMVIPPQTLSNEVMNKIRSYTFKISKGLKIKGPFNIQYLVKNNEIYVIECNLRASRSMPYVSKTSGVNLIKLATGCMLGEPLENKGVISELPYVSIKVPMFSWARLSGADPILGVEMASTGEIACMGMNFEEAFLKSLLATESDIPFSGKILVNNISKELFERIKSLGFKIIDKYDESDPPSLIIDTSRKNSIRKKASEFGIPVITRIEIANALVKSLETKPELIPRSLKEYQGKIMKKEMEETELRISKIEDGTVIDHITPGKALEIVKILKITEEYPNSVISIAMNVPSKKYGIKDILKIEGKRISPKEFKKIALISPNATVSLIKDFEVIKKEKIK